MSRSLAPLVAAALLALPAAPAAADVIVDTGEVHFPSAVWALGAFALAHPAPDHIGLAAAFTLSQTTRITDFESFFSLNPVAQSVHMGIADSLGAVPGSEIFSAQIDIPPEDVPFGYGWHGVHGANVVLGPGEYWITFEVREDDKYEGGLAFFAPNPTVKEATHRRSTGTWSATNDLDFSLRVFGDPLGAVPEPSTWTLMIAGFGATGAAIRRRRRQPACRAIRADR
ncbi:MAG: PEPxxWA-CTERM sorting domain-containing protein [Phenylobacterium sp.]|uniref:PEPxxWA-CTERM sorting domain-containing protein n=1 Tax=Phenylobacterium sp. TaxID=1871053 RepID=UPI001A6464EF|nr:PEPxxWA-CTERM sorting domain-containing protein [Phenylobacterium sp.]MBL8772678.1 PEPxxWA-CTERM sorting domain-containing protein [Phenylobacterium sp.]